MSAQVNRNRVLGVCCAAHAVQDGLGAALYVLLPILAQTFGLSYAQVGMIRAANACASTAFEMPSGVLSERYGERSLLVFGLLCAGVGYLCLSLSTGLWSILISLLIVGTGGAFQHALSSSLISKTYDAANRRSALGYYNSSGDAGKLAFTGMFGLATGLGIAWHGVVIIFALSALVVAFVVFYSLRGADPEQHAAQVSKPHHTTPASRWGIRNRLGFASLCLTVFLDTAVQTTFLVFVAFIIADKGVATPIATFAVVLTLVGGIAGKTGCGYLAQYIGVRNAFLLVQGLTAAGIVAVLFSPSLLAFVLLPALGVVLQGSTTITYGAIADLIRSDRQSRGFAMIYTVSSVSGIVGPVIFGFLSDYAGLNTATLALALATLLAIPPSLLLRIE